MNDDPYSLKGMKILVVDDTPANIGVLRRILEAEAYEIFIATSGWDALEIAVHCQPNLILLDIMMPDMDGFEVCRRFKSRMDTKDIPIIFISARGEIDDIVQGFGVGGIDYIVKPFRHEEVVVRVRTHLKVMNLLRICEVTKAQIKDYAAKLERSNRDLSDFTSHISHDLKEPLRKVNMFGELLDKNYARSLDEQGKGYLEKITNSAQKMNKLIDDLLSFSKIAFKEGRFELVDLNGVISDALETLELKLSETRGVVLYSKLGTVEADPLLIKQLFQNLIGNSLKFCSENVPPQVHISSAPLENGFCKIVVQDNGIGFDEKDAARIFKPFERLHEADKYEGSGLGLALCRKIVERHNGAISVASIPQLGTKFTVLLPNKQPDTRIITC